MRRTLICTKSFLIWSTFFPTILLRVGDVYRWRWAKSIFLLQQIGSVLFCSKTFRITFSIGHTLFLVATPVWLDQSPFCFSYYSCVS